MLPDCENVIALHIDE